MRSIIRHVSILVGWSAIDRRKNVDSHVVYVKSIAFMME